LECVNENPYASRVPDQLTSNTDITTDQQLKLLGLSTTPQGATVHGVSDLEKQVLGNEDEGQIYAAFYRSLLLDWEAATLASDYTELEIPLEEHKKIFNQACYWVWKEVSKYRDISNYFPEHEYEEGYDFWGSLRLKYIPLTYNQYVNLKTTCDKEKPSKYFGNQGIHMGQLLPDTNRYEATGPYRIVNLDEITLIVMAEELPDNSIGSMFDSIPKDLEHTKNTFRARLVYEILHYLKIHSLAEEQNMSHEALVEYLAGHIVSVNSKDLNLTVGYAIGTRCIRMLYKLVAKLGYSHDLFLQTMLSDGNETYVFRKLRADLKCAYGKENAVRAFTLDFENMREAYDFIYKMLNNEN
jgi:hypothetical protein